MDDFNYYDSRLDDTSQAPRLLQQLIQPLIGKGITAADSALLMPLLQTSLHASPDPDRALNAFNRWFAALEEPRTLLPLLHQSGVLARFCFVTGCSQYFADLLAREPNNIVLLAYPAQHDARETPARRYLEISRLTESCDTPEQQRDVLRRWKAREMLQIGVRDLLGLEDMPATAREFSNLADACVQMALDIALNSVSSIRISSASVSSNSVSSNSVSSNSVSSNSVSSSHLSSNSDFSSPELTAGEYPLAVFALGKLGGQELNYSSDIDLIFVHADGLPKQVLLENGRQMETPLYLAKLAETIIDTLTDESAYGHVFRVDMRLRPEGRFGPLTRSLASYRAYYQNWAESWERQTLLKARFIAGNRALGTAYLHMIAPYVYRRRISRAFLNDIRLNKRRIEQTCARKGEEQTNIKTGYGGIRDIEFIVQLLQLEFGGTQPRLRAPNTLTALTRLNDANFLTDQETEELADNYRWLRTLEHRLQLLNDRQTQTLPEPENNAERYRLARRMGYAARETFEADLQQRRQNTRAHLNSLFYDQDRRFHPALASVIEPLWEGVDTLLEMLDTPHAQVEMGERLTQAGFRNVPNALQTLLLLQHSAEFRSEFSADFKEASPLSSRFKTLAPHLLEMAAHSPDPDAALAGIEALAVPYRDQLYALFEGRPDFMWRLVRLAAVPALIGQLAKHQEWLAPLLGDNDLVPEALRVISSDEQANFEAVSVSADDTPDALRSERYIQQLSARISKLTGRAAQLKMVALFYQRERLRIAARDVWDEVDVADVSMLLSRLADAMLQILLQYCVEGRIAVAPDPEFARRVLSHIAIVGLGRLGGAELNYSSDWDLLFVYDVARPSKTAVSKPNTASISEPIISGSSESVEPVVEPQGTRHTLVSEVVQDFLATIETLKLYGAHIEVDMRLRPWGRQGGLIYSVRGYLDYFKAHAQTWERQAALKARYVAGSAHVGRRLERLLRAVSYGHGITAEEDAAIRTMKQRIELERLKSLERATDLKLGHGGLSDIEWLTQRLQLRCGFETPSLRVTSILKALEALDNIRALDSSEVNMLGSAYRLLTRVRNAMTLLAGSPHDVFPSDPTRRRVLARLLGYQDSILLRAEEILQEDVQADMGEVRRIFNRRFHSP